MVLTASTLGRAPAGSGGTNRVHQRGHTKRGHQGGSTKRWLCLLADNTQDRVNQFGTLCVMSFCTVIACTGLSKDWRNSKPYKHSQPSASLRTTSKTKSINLVPVYPKTKLFSLKGWSKGVHQNGTWHVARCGLSLKSPEDQLLR